MTVTERITTQRVDLTQQRQLLAKETDLAAATSDVLQAKAYEEALKERVRAGDPDVHPKELREARSLVEYAELRQVAAKRQAKVRAAEARQAIYDDYRAKYIADRDKFRQLESDLRANFQAAFAALDKLWKTTEDRAEHLAHIAQERGAVIELARQHNEGSLLPAQVVWGSDAPASEVVAMALDRLLSAKWAERRAAGSDFRPWSPDRIMLKPRHAQEAFPDL